MSIKIDISSFESSLKDLLLDPLDSKATRIEVGNLLYKMMEPYTPFETGTLMNTVDIDEHRIRYLQPYAHYMYEGIVYGPNIPIIQDGIVVGFFSIPGKKKSPTGKMINYSKEHHPLATRHWDEAMMEAKSDVVYEKIADIVARRINNGE